MQKQYGQRLWQPGSRRQCATANFSSSRHLPQRRPKSSSSRLTLPRLLLAMRAIQGVGTISGSRQRRSRSAGTPRRRLRGCPPAAPRSLRSTGSGFSVTRACSAICSGESKRGWRSFLALTNAPSCLSRTNSSMARWRVGGPCRRTDSTSWTERRGLLGVVLTRRNMMVGAARNASVYDSLGTTRARQQNVSGSH